MDIKNWPIEKQKQWLEQRGWHPHPDKPNVYIDPDSRMNCHFTAALERAIAGARLPADLELHPPVRK